MWLKRNGLWVFYWVFVVLAIALHKGEPLFISDGPYAAGKILTWFLWISFVGYSVYCNAKENFFKSVSKINQFHWGRQIGIDLYLGVTISSFLIYLNEGSLLFLAIWFLPILIFANMTILLYMALNYESLVSKFVQVLG